MAPPLPTPSADAPVGELGALLAALSDLVLVVDRDGVCRRMVPTGRAESGPLPASVIGHGPRAAFPAALADQMVATVRRAADEGRPVEPSYELDPADCRGCFVGTASPLGDGTVLWVARDVTAGRAADDARAARETRLRAALDASLDPVFLFDLVRGPDGAIVGLASTARDITARKRAEAEQRLVHEVTAAPNAAPDVAGAPAAALRTMCAGTELVYGEAWVPVATADATGAPWAPASHFLAPGAPAPHLLPPGPLVRGPAWHARADAALYAAKPRRGDPAGAAHA